MQMPKHGADLTVYNYILQKLFLVPLEWPTTQLNGAAEARRAHNPEVGGSKPPRANDLFLLTLSSSLFE